MRAPGRPFLPPSNFHLPGAVYFLLDSRTRIPKPVLPTFVAVRGNVLPWSRTLGKQPQPWSARFDSSGPAKNQAIGQDEHGLCLLPFFGCDNRRTPIRQSHKIHPSL